MKREEKKEVNDPLVKWMVEAGTDSPGEGFHISVLAKIETYSKSQVVYSPIISPFGWRLIFGFIVSIFGGTILFNPSAVDEPSLFDKIPPFKLPSIDFSGFNFHLFSFDFSPQFLTGIIAFFILGFVMILDTMRRNHASL